MRGTRTRAPKSALGLLVVGALGLGTGCAGGNLASELAHPPEFNPEDETKCKVVKSARKPLIVEWPSADRLDLEASRADGPIVVRYDGCEMQPLTGCKAPGSYEYQAVSPKEDTVVIKDEDELYAAIPLGAARLEGKLAKSGQLNVSMTMVGRWKSSAPRVQRNELRGSCRGATHVLAGLTVGAFEFFAGADAQVGAGAGIAMAGTGARSTAKRETLTRDGDPSACDASGTEAPPAGCSALLRVEVTPIGEAEEVVPTCPKGSEWDEDAYQCVGKRVVTDTECPEGSSWNGSACMMSEVQCPAGTELKGDRCVRTVADSASASAPAPRKRVPKLLSARYRDNPRPRTAITDEIRSREHAFNDMEKDHRLRPKAILGLAHRYVELAARAERDATEAYDSHARSRATKSAAFAHRAARKYYKLLLRDYPGVCIDGACGDQFLFEVAREYEASGSRASAKKYYQQISASSPVHPLAAAALARLD